jgi:CheY-like chemotaxis protein
MEKMRTEAQRPADEQAPEATRHSTSPPPFDLNRFARDAEDILRSGDLKHLGAWLAPVYDRRRTETGNSRAEGPARALFDRIDEISRRTELAAALLSAGGIPAVSGTRALCAQLEAIQAVATSVDELSIASLAGALKLALGKLGGTQVEDESPVHDMLIVEPDEVSRDLIALAVESQGHVVRVADNLVSFIERFREKTPQVILTDAVLPDAPSLHLCRFMREVVDAGTIPIVIFASEADASTLERMARDAGAARCLSKDQGIEALMAELNALFDEIVW